MKIAFLGLGNMGAPIVRLLLKAGYQVKVWNRTAEKAAALMGAGAIAAQHPSAAVENADVVFTMLNDDRAVESVVFASAGEAGILQSLRPGAIHVSLSTISVELSQRLASQHAGSGSGYVAAPVFGRPSVAAEGKLWIVVAGSDEHLQTVRPILNTFSRGITVVSSDPWRAHAFKIAGNFLITAMIESLSEALVFVERQGVDTNLFMQDINQALFRSPFYEAYGKVMLSPPEHAGATIGLGIKDMALFRNAAEKVGMSTPLADHLAADLDRAAETGLKESDWAAGLYQLAQNTSSRST